MIRKLSIAVATVLLLSSGPSYAIDCRAYQIADLRFKSAISNFDNSIRGNKEIFPKEGYTNGEKYMAAVKENLGEALNEYADEYIRIHFQGEVPEGVTKDQALVASHDYRDLCPGESHWGLTTLDAWLANNSLCLYVGGGALGTCGR